MADQWRGDALGCLGKEPVKTPCLDQLAREGVNFTNAVSSFPPGQCRQLKDSISKRQKIRHKFSHNVN